MNENLDILFSNYIENNFSNRKGIALLGYNSTGKTYCTEYFLKKLNGKNLIYLPEYLQSMETVFKVEIFDETENLSLRKLEDILEDRLYELKNEENRRQKMYDVEYETIIKIIFNDVRLINFFKEKLKFNLYLEALDKELPDGDKCLYIEFEGREKQRLTSSGYKSILRITTELFFSLKQIKSGEVYLFIDEIDSKLDWKNRENFFCNLYDFLIENFKNLKLNFIISTHMPETIVNLPENFSIFKFLNTSEFDNKVYCSNDFINVEQVERILFDKIDSIIKESQDLKRLKEIYFGCLKCSKHQSKKICQSTYSFNNLNERCDYNELPIKLFLSTKEIIIYNAILSLRRGY